MRDVFISRSALEVKHCQQEALKEVALALSSFSSSHVNRVVTNCKKLRTTKMGL
jgi:hypothetical protein